MPRSMLPFLVALFALLAPLPAVAQTPSSTPEKTFSIDVSNADLHAVVSMLEHQANVQVRVQDGSTPFKPVNVHLNATRLTKVLQTIAMSAGASVTQNAGGVYIFAPVDGAVPPSSPSAGPPQVQLQVAFVQASLADTDKMGLKFEALPSTSSDASQTPLKVARGESAAQAYQTLNRTHIQVVQAPMIVTNNTTASLSVETHIPKTSSPLTSFFRLHVVLTITPRINADGSVTLSIPAPNSVNGNSEPNPSMSFPLLMRTVLSGETMVICCPSSDKALAGQNLLLFLTPAIIGDSKGHSRANTSVEQPIMVML